jgi:hypothetical protein
MQEQKIDELQERSSRTLEELQQAMTRKLEAQSVIHSEIEAMRREDKILALTEEEERLLRSFRGFKARVKPGGVFKWQTRPDEEVVLAPETAMVTDAQDVS